MSEPGRLYVCSIPASYTEEDLRSLFSTYGEVIEVVILTNENGSSRQVGFVTFSTTDSATAAILGLHGFVVSPGEKRLRVKWPENQVERSERRQRRNDATPPFLNVPFFYPAPGELGFPHYFFPQGGGGVSFPPVTNAGGHTEREPQNPRKLFVSGLPKGLSNDDFTELCRTYGELECAYLAPDKVTGGFKRYGFAVYIDIATARRALGELRVALKANHGPTERLLKVEFADSKGPRHHFAQLAHAYTNKAMEGGGLS